MNLVNAHNISKAFADRKLFDALSFGILEKEHVGLIGPNGAGKSTLLKILMGAIEVDEGTVSRKKGLRCGMVEQTPAFKEGATLLDTVLEKADDPHETLAKAMEVMAHLNLNTLEDQQPISELSGGWKKRVALARELVLEPELLLLDEPTNHLDVSSILWLEGYLSAAPFAFLMITHDRLFLSRLADRILDLDPRLPNGLLNVKGSYGDYLEAKEIEIDSSKRHEWVQKNKLRREKEWLSRGSIARQTKQSARKDAAADLQTSVNELKSRNQSKRLGLDFGETQHSPKKLIEATGVQKTYGQKILFEDVNLLVTPNTRLALLGDNGCGKSTLIKILLQQEAPTKGAVKQADDLKVAYFEQSRDSLNPSLSVLKNLCPEGDYVFCQGQYLHVRSYLDRFLFHGTKAEREVRKLSGGERARLRLAQLMLTACQILILDEPTNDLDAETLQVLEESLKDFNGAVILVTHDRFFMDAVVDHILAFPPTPQHLPKLEAFSSYFQWETWFTQEITSSKMMISESTAIAPKKVKMSFKEKFELENMEKTILQLEEELQKLSEQSQDPSILSNHLRLGEVHDQMADLQAKIDHKYQRWSELETKSKGG